MVELDPTFVASETLMEGGITISVDATLPTHGYAVGGQVKPWHSGLSTGRALAQQVELFVKAHAEELALPGRYLGAWLDTADYQVWLDVTHVVNERGTALAEARMLGEIAIYDLDTRQEIRV
jgi:hypothetical protein